MGESAETGPPGRTHSPLPSLGTQAAQGVASQDGFQGLEHNLPQTTTPPPPSCAGADSLLHDEGESSPKSSIIPRLPPSPFQQAHLMCQPQERIQAFFQQTLQTPCKSLGSDLENRAKTEEQTQISSGGS